MVGSSLEMEAGLGIEVGKIAFLWHIHTRFWGRITPPFLPAPKHLVCHQPPRVFGGAGQTLPATPWNKELTFLPRKVTPPRMTTAIKATMRPYSTAVAPRCWC